VMAEIIIAVQKSDKGTLNDKEPKDK